MKDKSFNTNAYLCYTIKNVFIFVGATIFFYSRIHSIAQTHFPPPKLPESDMQRLKDAGFDVSWIDNWESPDNPIYRKQIPIYTIVNGYRKLVKEIPENDPIRKGFSDKALELTFVYKPRVSPDAIVQSPFPAPHPKSYGETHLNEEYRSAWEEVYQDRVINGIGTEKLNMPDYYMTNSLSEIAGTNSIPFLHDLYVAVLNEKTDKTQQRQNEMLKMLFCINAPEALDTVFSLLDLTESKTGTEAAATLREGLVKDLAQTLEKSETLNAYKNPNLSEKNRAFLETARKEEKEEGVR